MSSAWGYAHDACCITRNARKETWSNHLSCLCCRSCRAKSSLLWYQIRVARFFVIPRSQSITQWYLCFSGLPGFIDTGMNKESRLPMPGPELVARTITNLVVKPRREVVVPGYYSPFVAIANTFPWLVDLVMSRRK